MKTPIIKKEIENRPLLWSDIDGFKEIKEEAKLYEKCSRIILGLDDVDLDKSNNWRIFGFPDDFIRNNFNIPYALNFIERPIQLEGWFSDITFDIKKLIDKGFLKLITNDGLIPKYNSNKSIEENNTALEVAGYASYNNAIKERIKIFDPKTKEFSTFNVMYGDLKREQPPYFSTKYDSPDYAGQAQKDLPKDTIIRAFWEKWNIFHLQLMKIEEYQQMIEDLELVKKYGPTHPNYIEKGE